MVGSDGGSARLFPHMSQKRAPARTSAPQWGHRGGNFAPQLSQNLAVARLLRPQDWQFIVATFLLQNEDAHEWTRTLCSQYHPPIISRSGEPSKNKSAVQSAYETVRVGS